MKRPIRSAALAFIVVGGSWSAASALSGEAAAATIFSDQALFTAELGIAVTDDYESGYGFLHTDAAMSAVLGETDYTSTGFANNNIVSSGRYCAGCNGSFTLNFGTTSVGTSSGVFGVGFNFFNSTAPYYTAFITHGDGTTQNYLLSEALTTGLKFFGITSTSLIISIAFGLADGGTTTSGSFGIDNLTIGSALSPVPLPAALPLFLAGLAGLGFVGWRKNRRAALA